MVVEVVVVSAVLSYGGGECFTEMWKVVMITF